jgi:hypothetical protein
MPDPAPVITATFPAKRSIWDISALLETPRYARHRHFHSYVQRILYHISMSESDQHITVLFIKASKLSNLFPPYALSGGLQEAYYAHPGARML